RPQRGEIGDGGNSREVLQQHAGREERKLGARRTRPVAQERDMLFRRALALLPQRVLEEDADDVWELRDALGGRRVGQRPVGELSGRSVEGLRHRLQSYLTA